MTRLGIRAKLCDRIGIRHRQANNFTFQAQFGVGLLILQSNDRETIIAISWEHFSNADLFEDDDGIDLPLVLNFGIRF